MKKRLIFVISALICLLILSACDNGNNSQDETSEQSTYATDSTESIETTAYEEETSALIFDETTGYDIEWIDQEPEETAVVDHPYDDAHSWVFAEDNAAASWGSSGCTTGVEYGMLTVRPTTHDPYIYIDLKLTEYFDSEEYKYVAYRYCADVTVSQGVFFVASQKHPDFSDAGLKFFSVNTDNEWTDLIMDMSDCAFWDGKITKFRIDPINAGYFDEGSTVMIERVGFFKSEEDAEEFLSDAKLPDYSAASIIRGQNFRASLPAGVFDKSKSEQYELSSSNETDNIVTFNGKIIPLSYVNPVGFAFYAAQDAGNYATSFVASDPTDLGFLQARGIFTGKNANDMLEKADIQTLFDEITMNDGSAAEITAEIGGGSARDLSAAIYSFVKRSDIEIYKSVTRRIPVLSGNNVDALRYCYATGMLDIDHIAYPDKQLTVGNAALITVRFIKAFLGMQVLPSAIPEGDYMLIGAWHGGTNFNYPDIKTLAESGINLVISTGAFENGERTGNILQAASEYGVKLLLYNYVPWNFDPENPLSPIPTCGEYYEFPGFFGSTIFDEPGSDDYDKISAITNYYNQTLPGKVPFYNLLPMYANAAQLKYGASAADIEYYDADPDLYKNYVKSYADKVNTPYICVDIYPNRSDAKKVKTTYDGYLRNMDIFAGVCRDYHRDFWLYIQTTGLDGIRLPDYNDMRWQMYVGISFGVKNLIHFTYNTYPDAVWTESMVDAEGKPTSVYYAAQKANLEILALSGDYLKYQNLGAYNLNCRSATKYLQFDGQFAGIEGLEVSAEAPLLVGCFDKKDGDGYAFTLVNMTSLAKKNSKGDVVTFTLSGEHKVKLWQKGQAAEITPIDGLYTVTLEVAEGVFVTVD